MLCVLPTGSGWAASCLLPAVKPLPSRPTPVAMWHLNASLPMLLQVSGEREFFAQMVVDAVTALDPSTLDLKMVGMKKVRAGPRLSRVYLQGTALFSCVISRQCVLWQCRVGRGCCAVLTADVCQAWISS